MNGQLNGRASRYAQITGWGMYVPERVVTNDDIARIVDTTDEWILSRTGIRERHIASDARETTATLAVRAARSALRVAGVSPSQVGLVIVATVTPEAPFPSTASLVQDALGASHAGAFDLSAGCSGFVYALSLASDAIRAGSAEHVVIIGSETLSRITDWSDRNTCVLFGDGAGAVVLSACHEECGVLASVLGSDGSGGDLLMVPAGGSRRPASSETVRNGDHFIKMNGREVFRFATTVVPRATEAVVEKAGWQLTDIAQVIPHQANSRIIDSAAKRLGIPEERFFTNLERYGNTSAASVPIALCEAIQQGRIRPADKLVLVGFGAGLTWAAVALKWGMPQPMKRPNWFRRWQASIVFGWARVRSAFLRSERRAYDRVMGPVTDEGIRGRLRLRADRARERAARREQSKLEPPPD
jgi:3-oxoacyl-[acyl-carrier-protein] synthase-3